MSPFANACNASLPLIGRNVVLSGAMLFSDMTTSANFRVPLPFAPTAIRFPRNSGILEIVSVPG